MSAEALLAAGYALALTIGVGALEWLSAHTHRRAMLWRTAGFEYDAHHDAWVCPEGEHLWPHAYEHERRIVRYRARPQVCNACPAKGSCTDSDEGREVVRALDPWPHSEAGRFHRGISLVLIALAVLVLAVAAVRNREPAELALAGGALALCLLVGRLLLRDFRAHPAGFPAPTPSHGLGERRLAGIGQRPVPRVRDPFVAREE
ncbi:MAG TPA: transposase [Solirubrobacterales bacterium]|nr:transposase [Solirubrobacterales bacterium]